VPLMLLPADGYCFWQRHAWVCEYVCPSVRLSQRGQIYFM